MAQAIRQQRPQFSQPFRQIVLMLMVIGLSGTGAFIALPRVLPVFEANPYLNGFIGFVFLIGVVACFWQVFQLIGSVRWIERFASGELTEETKPTRLLASMVSLMRTRGTRLQLSATSTRSILDSVATRIDEQREITRYIVNLLIFLGLLGTFYGLATTVPAVVDTIRSLAPQEGEAATDVFNRLMTGLESQLGGMGVAFASSLLGLAGSLIVGLLELFAGHGQNRFYRELEEWLSTITRVGLASGEEGAGEGSAVAVLVEQMNENLDALQQMFAHAEASRAQVDDKLGTLAEAVADMTARLDRGDATAAALERVAQGQEALVELMRAQGPGEGMDAESRMRLRSIDVQMLRILEELSAGRHETLAELRRDIDLLAKAMVRAGPARGGPRVLRPAHPQQQAEGGES